MENPLDPINKADAAVEVASKAADVVDKAANTIQNKWIGVFILVLMVLVGFLSYAVYNLSNKVNQGKEDLQSSCQQQLQETKEALTAMTAKYDAAAEKNLHKDTIQALSNVTIGEQNQTIKYLQAQLQK